MREGFARAADIKSSELGVVRSNVISLASALRTADSNFLNVDPSGSRGRGGMYGFGAGSLSFGSRSSRALVENVLRNMVDVAEEVLRAYAGHALSFGW
jgi:hypothetical protein